MTTEEEFLSFLQKTQKKVLETDWAVTRFFSKGGVKIYDEDKSYREKIVPEGIANVYNLVNDYISKMKERSRADKAIAFNVGAALRKSKTKDAPSGKSPAARLKDLVEFIVPKLTELSEAVMKSRRASKNTSTYHFYNELLENILAILKMAVNEHYELRTTINNQIREILYSQETLGFTELRHQEVIKTLQGRIIEFNTQISVPSPKFTLSPIPRIDGKCKANQLKNTMEDMDPEELLESSSQEQPTKKR